MTSSALSRFHVTFMKWDECAAVQWWEWLEFSDESGVFYFENPQSAECSDWSLRVMTNSSSSGGQRSELRLSLDQGHGLKQPCCNSKLTNPREEMVLSYFPFGIF